MKTITILSLAIILFAGLQNALGAEVALYESANISDSALESGEEISTHGEEETCYRLANLYNQEALDLNVEYHYFCEIVK